MKKGKIEEISVLNSRVKETGKMEYATQRMVKFRDFSVETVVTDFHDNIQYYRSTPFPFFKRNME